MSTSLILAFLFFVGSMLGWCLEFLFRNLISHKGPRLGFVINPGFCRGPYLPIYGVGLCVMFVISYALTQKRDTTPMWLIVLGIGICMSLIEFLGGWMLLKFLNMRLWDYRDYPGNIKGFICPQFSLIWMILGGLYYVVVHPLAIDGLIWLSHNLAFSFFIGAFFGVFLIDFYISNMDALIIKEFGNDYEVVIRYDELKALVQKRRVENLMKTKFFNQTAFKGHDLMESLKEHCHEFESKIAQKLPERK